MQEVKCGDHVNLKAFPYAEADSLSGFTYKWYKNGSFEGNQSELKVDKVTQESCNSYYSCKILKNGEHSFSVYHCLRVANKDNEQTCSGQVLSSTEAPSPGKLSALHSSSHFIVTASVHVYHALIFSLIDCLTADKHLKVVREVLWDLRTQWYDLGLELDITQSTLKVCVINNNNVTCVKSHALFVGNSKR